MSNKEVHEFSNMLRQGLEIAERNMLEEKALHDEDIIVSPDGETFQRIPARQIIEETSEGADEQQC
ncbi:MAG: ribosome recycling factor [Bacteroidales bacterium]|nr:ribosome recycling factor [Bacteroidales bacterium]